MSDVEPRGAAFLGKWPAYSFFMGFFEAMNPATGKRKDGVLSQAQIGDDTHTVFSAQPTVIQVDKSHTPSDVKPAPVREPKPMPANALNPRKTDNRRVGY